MSTTITGLPNATTPLSGTERVPMDQAGATKDATTQDIANLAPGTDLSYTAATRVLASSTGADATLPLATTSDAGLLSSSDKTKLDGVAAGATANSSDATLLNRANHTGTQAAGTITGLANVATSGAYADLSGRPTLGTAAPLDVAASGDASSGQVVKGNDSRLTDARTPTAHTQAASTISDSTTAGRALLTAADAAAQRTSLGLGTAATQNTGTSAGNVVQLDGTGKLPAVDGSALTGLPPGITDLGYTESTRLLTSSTGADVTLPLFDTASSNAGLVPGSSTGGTTNFLRADGTWAAPPGGSPGGSDTHIQFNDGGAFGGDADLTYNKTTNLLTTKGDINLDDGGSFTTTLQTITATANRVISLPDATGTVALVAGSSGQILYNLNGALAGTTSTWDSTNGARHILPFGYGTGAGGTVTQATNKSTGVTLNARCGQVTMNNANLATNTAVTFTLTNSAIAATDILMLNHVSGGTLGNYSFVARCAAGSATIAVRNVSGGDLAEAVVIGFAVIKAVTS